jgi:hypothetical protein
MVKIRTIPVMTYVIRLRAIVTSLGTPFLHTSSLMCVTDRVIYFHTTIQWNILLTFLPDMAVC